MTAFTVGTLAVAPGTRGYGALPVTRTLRGDLVLPIHVVHGARPGPALGVLAAVHGDEILPTYALRELKRMLDPAAMAGTLVLVPVTNPLAFADFRRETAEQRENTDLHRAFPGHRGGSLTEMIAATLTEQLFPRLTALLDIHSGGAGGRTQQRADLNEDVTGEVRERSLALCRAFGTGLVHVNFLPPSSAVGCANARGLAAAGVELGGAYLPTPLTEAYVAMLVRGVRNALMTLGILAGKPDVPARQYIFTRQARKEANATRAGYLISRADRLEDLGRRVVAGELLGTTIDPYTLEVTEELRAPCAGILFFSRMSGLVEAGAKGFAVADAEGLRELP